jgi:hypothetical protein
VEPPDRLNRRQFAPVADLSAYRAARTPERPHPLLMDAPALARHVAQEHGVDPDEFTTHAELEFLHSDLHRAGRDSHVPSVEHTHSRNVSP